MHRRCLALALLLLLPAARPTAGQAPPDDVELLGLIHGTRPPDAYYALKAVRPDAFRIKRDWANRARMLIESPVGAPAALRMGRPGAGPQHVAAVSVEGTLLVPLVLGMFSDSPAFPPFTRAQVQTEFFDGPNSHLATITEFYTELSGGRIELSGETHDWVRSELDRQTVTAGAGALGESVLGFVLDVLDRVSASGVDWGRYDNDGADGIANSGDDDGYVDLLTMMHPTHGAECDGNLGRVWSHKWSLEEASGASYVTGSASANGGSIRVDDYAIQPVLSCDQSHLNEIGVFAHELGHAFGLQDLYCTATLCSHAGIGRWGLMGSGAWGCGPASRPERPCHMSAFSKSMLGWVDVESVPPDSDQGIVSLGPVLTDGRVLKIEAGDGSGDYFLLENRRRQGFDLGLVEEGMLAWRVDRDQLDEMWADNEVNVDPDRLGVGLLQADGLNDLGRSGGGRGDEGDPFPGSTDNRVLHTGSSPSSDTHQGTPSGMTLLDIERVGSDVQFALLTRFQSVTVGTDGGGLAEGLLTVDGQVVPGAGTTLRAAPFQGPSLEAAPGSPLGERTRLGFQQWRDDPSTPRKRTFVTGLEDALLVAEYGGVQYDVRIDVTGERFGVSPGTVVSAAPSSEDFWFPDGSTPTLSAVATTGFTFLEWTGDLAGQGPQATLLVDGPKDAGAVFEMTFGIVDGVLDAIEAAVPQEIVLSAENATAPVMWTILSGMLPNGLALEDGVLGGAALESGEFPIELEVRDALGLTASRELVLRVSEPALGVDELVAPFLLDAGTLTQLQRDYLDRFGNGNGLYDLGDFRAYVLAHPDLPRAAASRLKPSLRLGPSGPGDGQEEER